MSESQDETPTAAPQSDSTAEETISRRKNLRIVGTAVACLAVFALGTYGVKAFSNGATVVVEADEIATVLMKTGGVRLEEIDGPLILALHPGRNAVRAGQFRLVGEIEGVELNFSTGPTLQINKDDVVTLKIESNPTNGDVSSTPPHN